MYRLSAPRRPRLAPAHRPRVVCPTSATLVRRHDSQVKRAGTARITVRFPVGGRAGCTEGDRIDCPQKRANPSKIEQPDKSRCGHRVSMGEPLHPVAFDHSRDFYAEARPGFAGAGHSPAGASTVVPAIQRTAVHEANDPYRYYTASHNPTSAGFASPAGPPVAPGPGWQADVEPAPINRVLRFGQASASSRYEDDPIRSSRCMQLILCVGGTARYQCGNQTQQIRAGTIAWSVPELRFQFVDSSPDYDAWIAIVDAALVRQLGLAVDRRQGAALSRRITKVSAGRLQTQFDHLSTVPLGSDQFMVGLEYLILSAWAEQHRATRVDELTDVHPAVEKAAHILRNEPETGSLRDLARTCGASASWLSRLFREQLGVSLVGYRNQSRIERFFELYGEGRRRNLTQAALAAGFGSYAQFHRVFKDTLGFAPGDLKRGARVVADSDGASADGNAD